MSALIGPAIAQFTAGSTARQTFVQFGFVPDLVIVIDQIGITSPNLLVWLNQDRVSQWPDADLHLLLTGSTGVVTKVPTGIATSVGGVTIPADETINSNPVHPYTDGTFPKAGSITAAGIELPATILNNDATYFVLAWRKNDDGRQPQA